MKPAAFGYREFMPSGRLAPIVELLETVGGNGSLDRVAHLASVSLRQFRRSCLAESGLSPKMLSWILRFRSARARMQWTTMNLAHVAVDCGYYDQAHLIRHFRQFSGGTPGADRFPRT